MKKKKEKILVIGLGISGKSAINLLLKEKKEVVAIDARFDKIKEEKEIIQLKKRGVKIFSDDKTSFILWEEIALIVTSPGVLPSHKFLQIGKEKNIEIIGEIELAARYIKNICVGITGTNGKTTLTELISFILNKKNIPSKVLGNIGTSLSSYILNREKENDVKEKNILEEKNDLQYKKEEVLIIELSSFQLEKIKSSFLQYAVILNIAPDHLDWHGSYEKYSLAKCKIERLLKKRGKLFINEKIRKKYFAKKKYEKIITFEDISENENIFFGKTEDFFEFFEKKKTEKNKINNKKSYKKIKDKKHPQIFLGKDILLAAYGVCKNFGVTKEEFLFCCKKYKKNKHRIEFIAEINGIFIYNDSKATNPAAVDYAIGQFDQPIILIAGGKDKKMSYEKWKYSFKDKVKKIYLIGETAKKIKTALNRNHVTIEKNLKEAVKGAFLSAKKNDVILFSPGCSSFDMFKNYEHRGNEFKSLVSHLEKEEKIL